MNEVLKSLYERRSIRKFKPDMPEKEKIEAILKAGLYAPSGMGEQQTIMVAVTDKETRDKLSECNRAIGGWEEGFDPFYGAPAVIVVLANKEWPTHLYDGALVMGNLLNAAYAAGLGATWIHRAKEEFEMPEWKECLKALGVEGEWEGIGHCILGYPDEEPEAVPRKEGRIYCVE